MTPEQRVIDLFGSDGISGLQRRRVMASFANAIGEEREACADIALAIDSGRGNEKEIACAIRARS